MHHTLLEIPHLWFTYFFNYFCVITREGIFFYVV